MLGLAHAVRVADGALGAQWTVSVNAQPELLLCAPTKVSVRGAQAETRSWLTSKRAPFVAAAHDAGSRHVWAALRGARLACWHESDEERAREASAELPAEAVAVLALPGCPGRAAVVLRDGSVRSYAAAALDAPVSDRRNPAAAVEAAWAAAVEVGGRTALVVLEQTAEAASLRVYAVARPDGRLTQAKKHALGAAGVTACQVHPESRCVSVGWADGTLRALRFPAAAGARWLEAGAPPAAGEAGATETRLREPVRAIARAGAGQALLVVGDGRLGLWDLAFGALVASAPLPEECAKAATTLLALSPDGSRLAVGGVTRGVAVCAASVGERSVAALLGSAHATAAVAREAGAREPPLAAAEDVARLLDGESAAGGEREAADRATLAGGVPALRKALKGPRGRPSALVASRGARACVEQGAWDALAELLQSGAVSERGCPGLVRAVLESERLDVLELLLLHTLDLRERHLVRVLRFVTSSSALDRPQQKQKGKGKRKKGADVAERAARFLDLITSAPRSTGFLVNELRALTVGETRMLLRFLRARLLGHASDAPRAPSLAQAAEWTAMVIDAQFAALVLQGDAQLQALLADTLAIVRRLADDWQREAALHGPLETFAFKRTSLLTASRVPEYSTEVVSL